MIRYYLGKFRNYTPTLFFSCNLDFRFIKSWCVLDLEMYSMSIMSNNSYDY